MKKAPSANLLSERLSAMSDPLRLRAMRLLEREELSVGEIAAVLQLAQSTMSRHLKVLAETGLISRRARGTASLYRLTVDDLDAEARGLWRVVREQSESLSEARADRERLEGVLAARTTDSDSFFGRIAGDWDRVRGELFGDRFLSVSLLGLLPSDWVVADLGCGTGHAAEALADRVSRLIGVDQSGAMLEAARHRLSGRDHVTLLQGSLEDLPLESRSVDAAICMLALHHVENVDAALGEAYRVLRPGGVLLLVDMDAHDRSEYRHTMGHKHLGFSRERIDGLLAGAGFSEMTHGRLSCEPQAKGPPLFVVTARAAG